MASRAYAVFEIEGSERLPSIQKLLESCGAKHGTALLSHQTFRRPHASPGSMPVAIAPAFDDQTLCPNRRAVGFLFLQEILFGRKIAPLKKTKNGRRDMQSKIQIDQALP
jgi:hypothetical protein